MKSKLALAVSLALAGTAFAGQDQSAENPAHTQGQQNNTYSQQEVAKKPYNNQGNGMSAAEMDMSHSEVLGLETDEIKGKSVVDLQGEKVGDVDEVWINHANKEKLVIIDIQGVMGDNNKEVAVPLYEFQLTEGGDELRIAYSKEDLKVRPDFDENDYAEIEEAE